MTMKEVEITVRDGTRIGAAIYAPESSGRFPALLAASPYRYDNNTLPAGPGRTLTIFWRSLAVRPTRTTPASF